MPFPTRRELRTALGTVAAVITVLDAVASFVPWEATQHQLADFVISIQICQPDDSSRTK